MAFDLKTPAPLALAEWSKRYPLFSTQDTKAGYMAYLRAWYKQQPTSEQNTIDEFQLKYVQLLQELSYLFSPEESNLFLSDIDWTNEEDIVLVIPIFARKLKEISQVLVNKRESIKQAKQKYSIAGTNDGVETLLYQYILNGFTQRNQITQIPYSPLRGQLPALSSIGGDFRVEIEELYDTQTYFDSDPALPVSAYDLVSSAAVPFDNMGVEQLNQLLTNRFLAKVSDNTVSVVFRSLYPGISADTFDVQAASLAEQSQASEQYMGAVVYSVSGGYIDNAPDLQSSLDFVSGNNWFLWPNGSKDLNPSKFINTYKPIPLSASNMQASGATGGNSIDNSDLLFVERGGKVSGAWLSLFFDKVSSAEMSAHIKGETTRDFRYPYPGFNLTQIGLNWNGFNLSDDNLPIFNLLSNDVQASILREYWTKTLPLSSAADLDINKTDLVLCGAFAGTNSLSADVISLRTPADALSSVYTNQLSGTTQAFLYKFQYTDIPLSIGSTNLLWPVGKDSSKVQPTSSWCNDISLQTLWVPTNMTGAVAGLTLGAADQIYKLDASSLMPVECAWLKGASINSLYEDPKTAIAVYNRDATFCAQYLDGPIQPSLALLVNPGDIQSFIWMDQDTPADQVFAFVSHKTDCNYITAKKECNCKSIQYSPIGHQGDKLTDHNGVTDILFADPQGLGSNFAINTYTDTRGFNALYSPQFSFFSLTSAAENVVGWGPGNWKSNNGDPMILKTGSRYTYIRTPIPSNINRNSTYFVCLYPYKNISSQYQYEETDVVFLLDYSRSESANIDIINTVASQIIKTLLPDNQTSIQVAAYVFDESARQVFGFIQHPDIVDYALQGTTVNPQASTNYIAPLSAAVGLLTTNINPSSYNLCNNVVNNILNVSGQGGGKGRESALKKIVIIGDGHDTVNNVDVVAYWDSTLRAEQYPIQVFSISLGAESGDNDVMQGIARPLTNHVDLQSVIINQEVNLATFAKQIAQQIGNQPVVFPSWQKAINKNGTWVDAGVPTDMILSPGDTIQYIHTTGPSYSAQAINGNAAVFKQNATSFKIKTKLNGWDYKTSSYSIDYAGLEYGSQPFWGKVYNQPDAANNFNKETAYLGGHIRYYDDYIPTNQPEISDLVLTNDSWIQYNRKDIYPLNWIQPVTLNISEAGLGWLKLKLTTETTNLSALFLHQQLDKVVILTTEPSDILLESYTDYNLNQYNYWARQPFTYKESLYSNPACPSLFPIVTSVFISPAMPWANMDNVHFPTIAAVSVPQNLKSKKELGYLVPSNLGTSSYLGKGYTMTLNVSALSGQTTESLFWDLNVYGGRNRGLSKLDQLAPVSISNIDNSWLSAPSTTGLLSGTIINARHYQKMVPYQSDVETNGYFSYGLCRPEDYNIFWTTALSSTENDFNQAIIPLLSDVGTITDWATDIYGNEYGVFKS